MLSIVALSKSFGGVHAVRDISFVVPEASVYAIIGPNGSGKTTLLNLISGIYTPSSGSIRLKGEEISGIAPHLLARMSVSRTFQNLQICMNMSAIENVMIGAHLRLNSSLIAGMVRWPGLSSADRKYRDKAVELIEFVGCRRFRDADASAMPYGALKRLEIARALAAEPRLLLLDEPAAGLNPTETYETEELIRKLARTGITIILVEHDMNLVMGVSEHILVLDYGTKLAEGAPSEVRANPNVIAAYLGSEAQEILNESSCNHS